MMKQLKSKTSECQSTLAITGVGHAGDGLAREGEALWIVPGTFPGDTVTVRKKTMRAHYHVAVQTRLERASVERVPSFCREERCGGCSFREWAGPSVLAWKRAQVAQALAFSEVAEVASDGVIASRHRVRLHARGADVGYYEPGSHRLVAVQSCAVLQPGFSARLFPLLRAMRKGEGLRGEIEAVFADGRLVVEAVLEERTDAIRAFVSSGLIDGALEVSAKHGTRRHGEPSVTLVHPSGAALFLEPGVFSQANLGMNAVLVRAVAAAIPRAADVLELHAGAGNLTLAYAERASSVVASEWDAQAVMCLRRNVESARLHNVRVVAGADTEVLARNIEGKDTLLIDPPRTGAKNVCAALGARPPAALERIVYVSCDPGSLGRDARLLAPGFRVVSAQPIEMFPATPHVETVAVFARAKV